MGLLEESIREWRLLLTLNPTTNLKETANIEIEKLTKLVLEDPPKRTKKPLSARSSFKEGGVCVCQKRQIKPDKEREREREREKERENCKKMMYPKANLLLWLSEK